MKAIAFGLLAVATTASASDFSALARPEVVRYYLVPPPRQMEKQCAAFVLARGEQEPLLPPAQRTELLEAVVARLGIDTGDKVEARNALYDSARAYIDSPFELFAESRAVQIKAVRIQCAPFYSKVKAGGVAATLSPAPTGPLALPDGPTCYAAMQEADRRKFALNQSDVEPYLAKMLFAAPPPTEITANKAALTAATAKLAAKSPEREQLEMTINFACMPTIAELARRYPQAVEVER